MAEIVAIVGGFDGTVDLPSVEVSPSDSAAWVLPAGGMPTVRSAFGLAAAGGRVYCAGGSAGSVSHDVVESFTLTDGQCTWRSEPSLSTKRMAVSLVATLDGTLWCAGGFTHDDGSLTTVEQLAPGTAAWHAAPELLVPRCSFGFVESGGAALAFGGFGPMDVGALDSCELLDPRTATWQQLPPMAQRRSCLAAAALSADRILVCGGHDGARALDTVEVFDLRAGRWEAAPPMPTARSGPAAASVAPGKVWVLGGYPDGTVACSEACALAVVEVWDGGAWTSEASLSCGRTGAGAVSLGLGPPRAEAARRRRHRYDACEAARRAADQACFQ
jgi:hypothetical protein